MYFESLGDPMRLHPFDREDPDMTQTTTQPSSLGQPPVFARRWLLAAGVYNLIWGAIVIVAPNLVFDLAGMEPMRYPEIWQCVGMIVGVYGVGYLIASGNSRVHWPIVLVGLLGKVLGPIGFAFALSNETFPISFGWTIVFNDLIWWVPFSMVLWDAARARGAIHDDRAISLDIALDGLSDQHGHTLRSLNEQQPTLVTLTRHSGCTFCKEMLNELANKQGQAKARGMTIVIITMSSKESNARMADQFGLQDAHWFSDPDRLAYRALELGRGRFMQLFGPRVIWRGIVATLRGAFAGPIDGDGFQMPGAFVLHQGRVLQTFRADDAAAHPDYEHMICEVPS